MKYMVTVHELMGEGRDEQGPQVYQQTVDAEAFDMAALIRAVNTKKRGPRVRAGKKADAA